MRPNHPSDTYTLEKSLLLFELSYRLYPARSDSVLAFQLIIARPFFSVYFNPVGAASGVFASSQRVLFTFCERSGVSSFIGMA